MLWNPTKGRVQVEHNTGTVGAASPGTAVTTGAAGGTKGAVAQLIASTSFDAYWVTIMASHYGLAATASEGTLDILIGTSTEEVLIADLLHGQSGGDLSSRSPHMWHFPLYIPAGSRLSAKACGVRLSTSMQVWIFLYGGNGVPLFQVGQKVTTYGVTTPPNGTAITPGASGVEGTFTQIVASTTEDHFAFIPSFQTSADTTTNNRFIQVDLGVGAATEDEIGTWWFSPDSVETTGGPYPDMPTFAKIPSGTRLAVRASNSGANDGAHNVAIHAVS